MGSLPLYPLAVLLIVLAGSVAMFFWNVRRATIWRAELELRQWARNNRLTLDFPVPAIVGEVLPGYQTDRVLGDQDRVLLRALGLQGTAHLLLLRLPADWPPTALRPTQGSPRPIDSLPLRSYSNLPGTERFLPAGTTLHSTRLLADSPIRALLPPDLSLLLQGPWLLLDFSTRPFDPLEFSRMLSLGEQLLHNLPHLAS